MVAASHLVAACMIPAPFAATSTCSNATIPTDRRIKATCQQLKTLLGGVITLPSESQYDTLRDENWSHTAWKNPRCIAVPTDAADVQRVVDVLVDNHVPFAIRSGGHSANPQIEYDPATKLVTIGTGVRWGDVYTVLDPLNLTVVGGRVMDVGVGGLMLGGGLSYLSDLYGLACDNAVSYEVVLADGRVVQATATSHRDLFWALKGGINNFGILPAVLQAYNAYQALPNKDLDANMHLNIASTNGSKHAPAAFAPFYAIEPVQQVLGVMSLHELMSLFSTGSIPRWSWYATSFRPTSAIFAAISTIMTTAPEVAILQALTGGTLVGTVQPITANVAIAGRKRWAGGNALGLEPVNQTWFALTVGYWSAADDAVAEAAIASLHARVEEVVRSAGQAVCYIFMNDANAAQPVIASYGAENVLRLRAVQRVYDPRLVFRRLVPGGQKLG
ncbi:hypothetical protein B0T22DRAFT_517027 [Podospora appendiculata]|uniref:FAD-binding PCMH-type domain-containing protein n=1 Tax=Podospora appendiculata TaxID=314037 RepID=A0AAE0X4L7_9PEZI|nr:hypothetical protein B0T22DRAFT_517027 [Podospora appendiculata]